MEELLIAYIREKIVVSDDEIAVILSYFKPLRLKKNELLISQGETSQRSYFVAKGCLRIFFINEDGQDATRYFAFENNLATALVSFINAEPSEESIQAVEDSELLYISHANFHLLLELIPQWEKFYRKYLAFAYVTNTNRLMSFLTKDAVKKYQQLLAENPVIVRRLSNKLVASYLNISRETLSRVKAKA